MPQVANDNSTRDAFIMECWNARDQLFKAAKGRCRGLFKSEADIEDAISQVILNAIGVWDGGSRPENVIGWLTIGLTNHGIKEKCRGYAHTKGANDNGPRLAYTGDIGLMEQFHPMDRCDPESICIAREMLEAGELKPREIVPVKRAENRFEYGSGMRKRYYKTLARAEKAAKGQTVAKHRTARGRTLWVVYEEDTRPSKKVSKADREAAKAEAALEALFRRAA